MNENEIKNYIKDNLQKGYTIDKIEESLKSSLREEEYKSILKTYNKDNGNNTNSSNIEEKTSNKKSKEGMNIAVLILGILSLILFPPFALIAIILYFFSDKGKSGMAIGGLVVSIITIIIYIIIIFVFSSALFLQSYTQDTYDQIQGDATIDLAFTNKINMYDSGDDVVVNIARTIYPDNLTFSSFAFRGPNSTTISCESSEGYRVNANQSNSFEFSKTNDEDCSGSFVEGEYDLMMIGDTPVEVSNIDYR